MLPLEAASRRRVSVLRLDCEARHTTRNVASSVLLRHRLDPHFHFFLLLRARRSAASGWPQNNPRSRRPRNGLTIGAFDSILRRVLLALAPLVSADAILRLSDNTTSILGDDLLNYTGLEVDVGLEMDVKVDLEPKLEVTTVKTSPGRPRVSADVPIWVVPCYSAILLCAVVGNLLVVLTLVQNRRMRTITNVFLLNLAISDILLGVFCMPVTLVGTLLRHFIFGEVLCKLIQFAQAASVAVSSWTLVAISCERYYAICHPLRSRTWQTINHANKIIAIIWLGSLLCMTPIAAFSQLMPTSRPGLRKCREQWPADSLNYERAYNLFLDLALLVLPLLALSFTYLFITRTLYVSMRNERAMNFGSSGPETSAPAHGPAPLPAAPIAGPASTPITASQRRSNGSHFQQSLEQHNPQQYYYADSSYSHGGSKRRLLTGGPCEGRRHLYCMRSASVKSLRQQQQHQQQQQQQQISGSGSSGGGGGSVGGGGPGDCCSRSQRMRHQVQGYASDNESRRKSVSQPSLRITEVGLRSIVPRRSNESKSLESKKRVVKMLFVLVLEFFICWTPLYVINTMTMLFGPVVYEYVGYTAISFLQLLAYSSSCCNPITYCFMNASFRRAFVDTFRGMNICERLCAPCCFWRRRSKNETNLSVAGNSIALANSAMSSHTILESPRL
ncbi:gastrin/cholecystokinin type B receptor [Drosophila ananassae]|uniref:gastrin/cholecystokinin type B receptor n=1 Tax=Drosophila ananassae TaxID=7217 RepID=UPI0013A5E401|nr:gastrin/cholecystokinin type B receptor [Drosophila ananassae]